MIDISMVQVSSSFDGVPADCSIDCEIAVACISEELQESALRALSPNSRINDVWTQAAPAAEVSRSITGAVDNEASILRVGPYVGICRLEVPASGLGYLVTDFFGERVSRRHVAPNAILFRVDGASFSINVCERTVPDLLRDGFLLATDSEHPGLNHFTGTTPAASGACARIDVGRCSGMIVPTDMITFELVDAGDYVLIRGFFKATRRVTRK